jgi:hypothetical protein
VAVGLDTGSFTLDADEVYLGALAVTGDCVGFPTCPFKITDRHRALPDCAIAAHFLEHHPVGTTLSITHQTPRIPSTGHRAATLPGTGAPLPLTLANVVEPRDTRAWPGLDPPKHRQVTPRPVTSWKRSGVEEVLVSGWLAALTDFQSDLNSAQVIIWLQMRSSMDR